MNWTLQGAALTIGYAVMLGAGGIVAGLFLAGVWFLVGLLGRDVFKRLRRIYHLRVIGYWLDRLEKVGLREFEKAEQQDQDQVARGVKRTPFDAPL